MPVSADLALGQCRTAAPPTKDIIVTQQRNMRLCAYLILRQRRVVLPHLQPAVAAQRDCLKVEQRIHCLACRHRQQGSERQLYT